MNGEELEKVDTNEIDKVPIVESGLPFDSKSYQGLKIKIEKVWIDKNAINWYNGPADTSGRPTYNPSSTEIMQKVVIETYPLPKLDDSGNSTSELLSSQNEDGSTKHYTVSARFNLQNKNGVWSISKSPNAKLWKFMRKCGVNILSELKDKIVVLDTQPSRDETDDRVWLRISM